MSASSFREWGVRAWPWAAAVASGALLTLCFAPWNQSWLVWIALAPLLSALWFAPKPRPFALGFVTGAVFYPCVFHWLAQLSFVIHAPILLGLPPLLGSYLALYIALWAWAMRALRPRRELDAWSSLRHLRLGALAACLWVALEWTRGWFLSGFGWNELGVALHGSLAMVQIADLAGLTGLTWLVAFVNVMAVVIVRRLCAEFGPDFLKRIRWEFTGTMLVVAAVFAYGAHRLLHEQDFTRNTVPLRIAVVQPNVPQDVKFDAAAEDAILDKLRRQTSLAALLEPQLLLWPEAPAIRGMDADEADYKLVMDLAASGPFDFLLGSLDYEPDPKDAGKMRIYNAAYLLTGHGAERQTYRKTHLVIFGEYLPLRDYMPGFVQDFVPGDLEANQAHGPGVLRLSESNGGLIVAPLICFEDSLGELTRQTCVAGAQLLVNITNDGWFRHSVGAEQHLAHAVFRAVENRRPLIRCCNTGMTGSVDPLGRFRSWVPPFREGIGSGVVPVPVAPTLTFYTRHGDWVAHLSAALCLVWLSWRWWQRQGATKLAVRDLRPRNSTP